MYEGLSLIRNIMVKQANCSVFFFFSLSRLLSISHGSFICLPKKREEWRGGGGGGGGLSEGVREGAGLEWTGKRRY